MVDRPITPHWSTWTQYTIHKVNKAQGTTTYISRRYYWEPKHPTDPRAGSKVTKTEQRFTTRQTPRVGEPGGVPYHPRREPGMVVTPEPSVEYKPPTSETIKEHIAEETGGREVIVEYRDPSGNIKRVATRDPKRVLSEIRGEVLFVREHTPKGRVGRPFYDVKKQVMATPSIMETTKTKYFKTGKIPSGIDIEIPQGIQVAGSSAVDVYRHIVYRKSLGLDTTIQEQNLENFLLGTKAYVSTQPIFGEDGKTWGQIKADDPALYLKLQDGKWTPTYDIKRWKSEEWAKISEPVTGSMLESIGLGAVTGGRVTSLAQAGQAISGSYLNIFDPGYWTAEDKPKYLYEKEYGMVKQIKEGDKLGAWIGVQAPAYTNIILPFAAGAALGPAMGGLGKLTGVGGTILGKGVPVVVMGGVSTVVGADIGFTAATTGGFGSKESLTKIGTYGMQFTSAGAGAMWATSPQTIASYNKFMAQYKTGLKPVMKPFKPITSKISTYKTIGIEHLRMKGMVRGYPFYTWEGTRPPVFRGIGARVKGALFEPSAARYMEMYTSRYISRASILGTDKPFLSRELMSTWEQIRGKPMDPFAARTPPRMWGSYETSWKYYVSTLKPTPIAKPKLDMWKGKYLYDPKTGKSIMLETGKLKPLSFEGKIIDVGKRTFGYPKFETRLPSWIDTGMASVRQDIILPKTSLMFPDVYRSIESLGLPSKSMMLKTVSKYIPKTRGLGDITRFEWYQSPVPKVAYTVGGAGGFGMPSGYALAYGYVPVDFLDWLEEGTQYVHPRWDKTKQITTPSLVFKTDIKQIKDVMQISKTEFGTKGLQAEGLLPVSKLRKDVFKENLWRQELGRVSIVTPALAQSQAQQQKQLQALALIHPPSLKLKYKFRFKPSFEYKYKFEPPSPPPPSPPILFPFLFPDGGGKKQAIKPSGQGYGVWVKDRYIVSGKKKYDERFIRLTKRILSKQNALSLGAAAVDNSAARTFKIKPVVGTIVKPRIPTTNFDVIQNKFYNRKGNIIERTSFAIDSPGEIREISARGWIAEKRKLHPKPHRVVSRSRVIKSSKKVRGMNNNMKKLLRRYGF